jgi:Ca2+-binding RTX toxin-like protein
VAAGIGIDGYGGSTRDTLVLNHGRIEVRAEGDATGVTNGWGGFKNDGSLVVVGRSNGIGVNLYGSAEFLNSGAIEVTGGAGFYNAAIGVIVYNSQGPAEFTNSGSITIHRLSADAGGVGVQVAGFTNLRNTGTIDAPKAIVFVRDTIVTGDGRFLAVENTGLLKGELFLNNYTSEPVSLKNAGSIVGNVTLNGGADSIVNGGSIQGAADLGAGNDTYLGASGAITGMVSGGEGADSLSGGSGFDNFQGNMGNDTEAGGPGDDWVVGGRDDDLLLGDGGADLVYGNLGNDTCDGGQGADIDRGGQDNDVVRGGDGDDYVSGDKGSDTVAGGAGADVFHTFGDAGLDRVLDFNLAEGDRVQVDPGTQYTISQVGADTVIDMVGGGQMILIGVQSSSLTSGWIFGA